MNKYLHRPVSHISTHINAGTFLESCKAQCSLKMYSKCKLYVQLSNVIMSTGIINIAS